MLAGRYLQGSLQYPLGGHFKTYKVSLCVILGSLRCLNAMCSQRTALSAERQGLGIGAAWQAWTPLRRPCFPWWGGQKKHPIPGTAGTGVRSWGKSRTLQWRIYLEIRKGQSNFTRSLSQSHPKIICPYILITSWQKKPTNNYEVTPEQGLKWHPTVIAAPYKENVPGPAETTRERIAKVCGHLCPILLPRQLSPVHSKAFGAPPCSLYAVEKQILGYVTLLCCSWRKKKRSPFLTYLWTVRPWQK